MSILLDKIIDKSKDICYNMHMYFMFDKYSL